MFAKTKIINTTTEEHLVQIASSVGIMLMSTAAVISMLDLPDRLGNRLALPAKPAFAFASQNINNSNPLRREREETDQHYVAYSIAQRTPGRSSKR